jgi:hypothetical protein
MKEAYCHICGCFNDQAGYRKICTKCTTKVTKYSKYLREGSQEPEHLELIDYLDRIFAVNRLERKYVHKVFYTHGGGKGLHPLWW